MESNKERQYKSIDPDQLCLSRLDWLVQLHKLFGLLSDSHTEINLDLYQQSLFKAINSNSLRLDTLEHYSRSTEYFTMAQVMIKMKNLGKFVTWDQIFNCLALKAMVSRTKTEKKIYPEVNDENLVNSLPNGGLSSSILYLNLNACNLEKLPALPCSVKIVNISDNALTEIDLVPAVEYLNANKNCLSRLGLPKQSEMQEMYVSANQLENLEGFQRLIRLRILEISDNKISFYEDLAILTMNYKLEMLSVFQNPIDELSEDVVQSILPKVKIIHAGNQHTHSKCPFPAVLFNHSFQNHKRTFTLPLDLSDISGGRKPCSANFKTPSRGSRASSPSFCQSSYTKSVCYNFSPVCKENVEKKVVNYSQRRSNSTVITTEGIAHSTKIKYGNPIAALMIKPSSKRRLLRKK